MTTRNKALRAADGGYSSRKFWFAIATSAFIFVGAIFSGVWKIFGPHYETMISGLCGVLAIYMGGNVTAKMAIGKFVPQESPYGYGGGGYPGSYPGGVGVAVTPLYGQPNPQPPVEPIPEEQ